MRMDDEMARAVIEEELKKQLKYKSKFKEGDLVIVPAEIAELRHCDAKGSQIGEVITLSKHVFVVQYESGIRQGIQYSDVGKIKKLVDKIA